MLMARRGAQIPLSLLHVHTYTPTHIHANTHLFLQEAVILTLVLKVRPTSTFTPTHLVQLGEWEQASHWYIQCTVRMSVRTLRSAWPGSVGRLYELYHVMLLPPHAPLVLPHSVSFTEQVIMSNCETRFEQCQQRERE